MQVHSGVISHTSSRVVVGLFTGHTSICDAIADLHDAGFGADRIALGLSQEGKLAEENGSHAKPMPWNGPLPTNEHTWMWRLRHAIDHDAHHHHASLVSADAASRDAEPLCSEIDLSKTLAGFGVAEDRIWLLNREVGVNGALMFVDADEQWEKVETIVERNCGLICTGMALERPPHAVQAQPASPPATGPQA